MIQNIKNKKNDFSVLLTLRLYKVINNLCDHQQDYKIRLLKFLMTYL
jgi:hypothetical protein